MKIKAVLPKAVQKIRSAFPDIQAVFLFGSYAEDRADNESDVDIALLLPPVRAKTVNPSQMEKLRLELEPLLKTQVDLVNLRQVNTVFQNQIVTFGERLYTGDRYEAEVFEMLTLSFYQKLNEERAEILEDIRKTGRILKQ